MSPFENGETGFTMDASSIKFGPGMTRETGFEAARFGCTRVMVVTDPRMAKLEPVANVLASLQESGIEAVLFDGVRTEPTDASFNEAVSTFSIGLKTAPRYALSAGPRRHRQAAGARDADDFFGDLVDAAACGESK